MDLSRPTVCVSHDRVSLLRCRGSRLGKGGSRVYDCYLVVAWSELGLSIPMRMSKASRYFQVYNEVYSQWQDKRKQTILIVSCLVYRATANGVAWAWHGGVAISGRRFPIHLTRRSSQQARAITPAWLRFFGEWWWWGLTRRVSCVTHLLLGRVSQAYPFSRYAWLIAVLFSPDSSSSSSVVAVFRVRCYNKL